MMSSLIESTLEWLLHLYPLNIILWKRTVCIIIERTLSIMIKICSRALGPSEMGVCNCMRNVIKVIRCAGFCGEENLQICFNPQRPCLCQ